MRLQCYKIYNIRAATQPRELRPGWGVEGGGGGDGRRVSKKAMNEVRGKHGVTSRQ